MKIITESGICPKTNDIGYVEITYKKVPILGNVVPEYKKTVFSCDNGEDCDICDKCPIYENAEIVIK